MLDSRTKTHRFKVGSVVATGNPRWTKMLPRVLQNVTKMIPEATQRTPEGGFGDPRGGCWGCRRPQDVQKPLKKVVVDEIVDSEGNTKQWEKQTVLLTCFCISLSHLFVSFGGPFRHPFCVFLGAGWSLKGKGAISNCIEKHMKYVHFRAQGGRRGRRNDQKRHARKEQER